MHENGMSTPKPTVKLRMKARVAWNDFSSILLVQTNFMSTKSNHVRCFQETESSSVLVFFSFHARTYLNMYICVCFSSSVHPVNWRVRSLARLSTDPSSKGRDFFFVRCCFCCCCCLFTLDCIEKSLYCRCVSTRKTTTTTPTPLSNNTSVKLSPVLIIYVINTKRNTKSKQVVFFRCSHRSCVRVCFCSRWLAFSFSQQENRSTETPLFSLIDEKRLQRAATRKTSNQLLGCPLYDRRCCCHHGRFDFLFLNTYSSAEKSMSTWLILRVSLWPVYVTGGNQ